MYLKDLHTDNENETITMQFPGGEDDWDDEDEDGGWDDIEDEDFEDELNDKNDVYETELDENELFPEDDDHLPEEDEDDDF